MQLLSNISKHQRKSGNRTSCNPFYHQDIEMSHVLEGKNMKGDDSNKDFPKSDFIKELGDNTFGIRIDLNLRRVGVKSMTLSGKTEKRDDSIFAIYVKGSEVIVKNPEVYSDITEKCEEVLLDNDVHTYVIGKILKGLNIRRHAISEILEHLNKGTIR